MDEGIETQAKLLSKVTQLVTCKNGFEFRLSGVLSTQLIAYYLLFDIDFLTSNSFWKRSLEAKVYFFFLS